MKGKINIIILTVVASVISTSMIMKYNSKATNDAKSVETSKVDEYVSEVNATFDSTSQDELIEDEEPQYIEVDSTMPYYIRINNLKNVVNVYSKVEDKVYEPYKVMLCSTGKATPKSGEIHKTTTLKCRWSIMKGGVYVQYATQIVDSIFFHSVPYTKENASTLEYWEYDKLGEAASLGCIRLTAENAKWIYDNIEEGTCVEFYEDENPGPFGKPEGVKISDNELCRGWDPTDIADGNPWNT